ncbi:abortive infection family protein [Limnobacter profundi]|uniref:Abortive infection family protein n=1 Tax=Limnobacter profundi TaxID=2732163 RepID=A0ABX6N3I2_9BURK|nr:abortive infection family protein [Limnobacter sp. SAORIC-580]QJR28217.1 abortive infection family protein [Limnobacter sp. SAORIC-580]
MTLPITETIIAAIAQLVDDSKSNGEYREPSHSDIGFYVERTQLTEADPKANGQSVGKAKRVRAILSWAIDNNSLAGSKLIELLMSKVRASGGFRQQSVNFVGNEAIDNAIAAFSTEGFELARDGEIRPRVLENLRGKDLTDALRAYSRRAQKGAHDAALLSGTGKDLLEATAAHVIQVKYGAYPMGANFQGLLGQAYMALGLTVPEQPPQPGEPPIKALERSLFQSACAINKLRNKEGTGHGRPWLPSLSLTEATAAIELVGTISGFLLARLDEDY